MIHEQPQNIKRNVTFVFVLCFCWFLVLATPQLSQIGGGLAAMHMNRIPNSTRQSNLTQLIFKTTNST